MARAVVCIPTFNEALNIAEVLRRTRASNPDVDILVADDSSPDGTADVARRLAAELGRIDVMVNGKKLGLGEAYRRAFARVLPEGYDVVCQMDADLSHDPAALPHLIERLAELGGDGVVIGSRYVEGGSIPHWPWHRRALSKYGNRYAATILAVESHDLTSGFRAFSASALKAIDYASTRATGYGFQIECAYRAKRVGLPVGEYPIEFTDRVRGVSKLSPRVAAEELLLVSWWGARDRVLRRPPAWTSDKH